MAKQKPQMGWVYSPTATKAQKDNISKQFEPIIDQLKKNFTPVPEPQEYNHCIDVFSKWRGNSFYITQKYKVGGENRYKDFFDTGIARLEYYGENRFNLSFYTSSGKWEPHFMYQDVSFEEAQNAILKDSMLQVF
ncbi:MAG: hypothetical protein R3E32_04915 [Chitinophagales bacterium]